MRNRWLVCAALALSPLAWAVPQDPPPAPVEAPAESPVDALGREYGAATKAWREELRAAAKESKEREAEVKARHPVRTFWPRFEALAQGGEGRALAWMVEASDDYLGDKPAIVAKKSELVAKLLAEHADASWAADGLVRLLPRQRVWFDEAWVRAQLEELAKRSKNAEVSAAALYELAARLSASRATPEEKQRGAALLERIEQEFPASAAARQLRVKKNASAYEVGGTPEDFDATDPDGAKFKLSDYRGKVVMLDFWGFW